MLQKKKLKDHVSEIKKIIVAILPLDSLCIRGGARDSSEVLQKQWESSFGNLLMDRIV